MATTATELPTGRGEAAQRAFDALLGLPAGLAALPLVLAAALLVTLTSRGPAFYTQERAGRRGRPFRIVKLRTMIHDCEAETGACWREGDPRITRVGYYLRRFHVDEIPQLWNVLRGEMSLVGPRPERPEILDELEPTIPNVRDRLAVRPGVTGLAQIQQPPDITPDCFRRKLAYDRHYIRQRGLRTDAKILFGTALYLVGLSYARVRAWAGLSVPVMPDEVLSYRASVAAPRDAAAPSLLEAQSGVSG